MNRAMLMNLSERTIVALARTALYGLTALLLANGHGDWAYALTAAVLGGMLADYLTWAARTLVELPGNVLHGSYEAAVNFVFAAWFVHFGDFRVDDDGSSLAFAFVAFMLVLGCKLGWFALESIGEQMTDF